MVELWPVKPRADSAVPPLPGVPMKVTPGERVTASCTVALLRLRICSALMLVTLAGVSSGVSPRREPLVLGVCRSGWGFCSATSLMAVAGKDRAFSSSAACAGRDRNTQGARLAHSSVPERELNRELRDMSFHLKQE